MKKTHALIVLALLAAPAFAQKGTLQQQKTCYEQAHQRVRDFNEGGLFPYAFSQAHYDSKTQTCYVEMDNGNGSGDSMVLGVIVEDAYEGKMIAECHSTPKEKEPEFCQVNGQTAESRAHFNYLLWRMIPAFKPVEARTVK